MVQQHVTRPLSRFIDSRVGVDLVRTVVEILEYRLQRGIPAASDADERAKFEEILSIRAIALINDRPTPKPGQSMTFTKGQVHAFFQELQSSADAQLALCEGVDESVLSVLSQSTEWTNWTKALPSVPV